ncbi:MAG: ATP synthase subunit I [Candidatus Acidiferrales bacterium]
MASEAFGTATLRRIEWLTLALGAVGAVAASWRWGWRGAVGLAIGAVLSWINFRWLKGSVLAFGRAATVAPATPSDSVQIVRVPKSAYAKFFGRFALLLIAVYVILTHSFLPAVSVLAGLFASAVAVVLGILWELTTSGATVN